MQVEFIFDDGEYKWFDVSKIGGWIKGVIEKEKKGLGEIVYRFVSEREILEVNREFLKHNYFTDIITFDESFVNIINGSIYVSLETVKYNAQKLNISFEMEVFRVIIHGIMHLCGYKDSTKEEKRFMRDLEDKYLAYLEKL